MLLLGEVSPPPVRLFQFFFDLLFHDFNETYVYFMGSLAYLCPPSVFMDEFDMFLSANLFESQLIELFDQFPCVHGI